MEVACTFRFKGATLNQRDAPWTQIAFPRLPVPVAAVNKETASQYLYQGYSATIKIHAP